MSNNHQTIPLKFFNSLNIWYHQFKMIKKVLTCERNYSLRFPWIRSYERAPPLWEAPEQRILSPNESSPKLHSLAKVIKLANKMSVVTLPAVTWKLPATLLRVRAPCTLQASLCPSACTFRDGISEYSREKPDFQRMSWQHTLFTRTWLLRWTPVVGDILLGGTDSVVGPGRTNKLDLKARLLRKPPHQSRLFVQVPVPTKSAPLSAFQRCKHSCLSCPGYPPQSLQRINEDAASKICDSQSQGMATVMSTLSFSLACRSASGAKRNFRPGQKK